MDQAGRLEKGMQASVRWSSIRIVVYATSKKQDTCYIFWQLVTSLTQDRHSQA